MDPNQQSDQNNQDLIIAPEDSLMPVGGTEETSPQTEPAETGVSYTPPKEWGGDQTMSPVGTPPAQLTETPTLPPIQSETPLGQPEIFEASPVTPPTPIQTIPTPPVELSISEPTPPAQMETPMMGLPPVPPAHQPNPILRAFLISLALMLLGILIGVLASRFVPMTPSPAPVVAPTPEITEEITPTEVPIVTPTATPSALLELEWKMMTVKTPLTGIFSSYQFFYPTTWSIKEYKNTKTSSSLILTKGTSSLSITQGEGSVGICLYPGDSDVAEGAVSRFGDFRSLVKNLLVWRWAMMETTSPKPLYQVCQQQPDTGFLAVTDIGSITLSTDDPTILEEFNYILEKLVILE